MAITAISRTSRPRPAPYRPARKSGTVSAPPRSVARRRRGATMTQLNTVPAAQPMTIQTTLRPLRYAAPGRPISSHALMSLAWALTAVTHTPKRRPPRTKSASVRFSREQYAPIAATASR